VKGKTAVKLTHAEYVAAYRVAARKAIERGFTAPAGKGYWKALHAFCDREKIKLPTQRKARVLPS